MKAELRNLRVAVIAIVLVLGWQIATVYANYRGNWTALFCIGEKFSRPPGLDSNSWIFANSHGYDGQWYRLVANDPWMRTDLPQYVDAPERYQRILLPAVAWLMAFGHAERVDAAYIIAVLIFLFAGVWITAEWSVAQGRSPWWGLGFALLPGTLITADRMTVDVAEYAFLAAGLYSWRNRRWTICWFAAAAAFLTRELGLLLVIALVRMCLAERAWRRAILITLAAAPGFLWYSHVANTIGVAHRLDVVPRWVFGSTLAGPFYAILHPTNYPLLGWIKPATQVLDGASIAGVVLAVCLAIFFLMRRPVTLESVICVLYVIVFVMVARARFWVDPYSFPRAFSPLAALIAWRGIAEKRACFALPLFLMLARVLWQMGPQALGISKALFG